MYNSKKIVRSNINKENMVVIGYCQAQTALNMFGYDYKIGYNSGVYGWNYDLYRIGSVDIVTGYNCPYVNKSKKEIKTKLIVFENKLRKMNLCEFREKKEELQKEFLNIFE